MARMKPSGGGDEPTPSCTPCEILSEFWVAVLGWRALAAPSGASATNAAPGGMMAMMMASASPSASSSMVAGVAAGAAGAMPSSAAEHLLLSPDASDAASAMDSLLARIDAKQRSLEAGIRRVSAEVRRMRSEGCPVQGCAKKLHELRRLRRRLDNMQHIRSSTEAHLDAMEQHSLAQAVAQAMKATLPSEAAMVRAGDSVGDLRDAVRRARELGDEFASEMASIARIGAGSGAAADDDDDAADESLAAELEEIMTMESDYDDCRRPARVEALLMEDMVEADAGGGKDASRPESGRDGDVVASLHERQMMLRVDRLFEEALPTTSGAQPLLAR